jgi:hypothetical protein
MAWVYILRGSCGRHYIGSTEDLDRRLAEHRRGKVHSTHRGSRGCSLGKFCRRLVGQNEGIASLAAAARKADKAAFGAEADFPQAHRALLTMLDKLEPLLPRSANLT